MPEDCYNTDIIIFANSVSMRRYQQNIALDQGYCDTSNHFTFYNLYQLILDYYDGFSGRISPIKKRLMQQQVIIDIRKKDLNILHNLSSSSCCYILQQIENEFSLLPEFTEEILKWMLDYPKEHRLHQLALLYKIWNKKCEKHQVRDKVLLNRLVLEILKDDVINWPKLLRNAKTITFQNVRWMDPFEEQFILYLCKHIDVKIESALPTTHAEDCADILGQQVAINFQTNPWADWIEDLSDALVLNDNELIQNMETEHIDFSYSAGPYGEIEDLARRIIWCINQVNYHPHQIAIIVPTLSLVDDIIPHVFGRFKLPYYFRRGRPVLSSPAVKAFISWLSFPLSKSRDDLIDLIRNTALSFQNRDQKIEKLLLQPPQIDVSDLNWFIKPEDLTGLSILEALNKWLVIPNDDHFNNSAIEKLQSILNEIGDRHVDLNQTIDLIIESLRNENILPENSKEGGISILSLDDAVGVEFDLVCYALLNEGICPKLNAKGMLLNEKERELLHKELNKKSKKLPRMALPSSSTKLKQQYVSFLTALGIAKKQAIFSYSAFDSDGREQNPSLYFRQLWRLAGWSSVKEPTLSSYNKWRISTSEDKFLLTHIDKQNKLDPYDRKPMPGESFLSFTPIELSIAEDEILQKLVSDTEILEIDNNMKIDKGLINRISIENQRYTYLNDSEEERKSSVYCGHIESQCINEEINQLNQISATGLEELMHCRYFFLIKRVLGIKPVDRNPDDFPDPLDRGNLIHTILKEIYLGLRDGSSKVCLPKAWAVMIEGKLIHSDKYIDGNINHPLLVFSSDKEKEIMIYAKQVISDHIKKEIYGNAFIWSVESEKISESVIAVLKQDIECNRSEYKYFPAIFEFEFGKKENNLVFDINGMNIIGKIDRIDLCFDADSRELIEIQVLDYKGSSKGIKLDRIEQALDCQLMIYAFATQKYFYGAFNQLNLNNITRIGYISYEDHKIRSYKGYKESKVSSFLLKDEPNLTNQFIAQVTDYIDCIRSGNFSIDPYFKKFEDYESLLRNSPVNDI